MHKQIKLFFITFLALIYLFITLTLNADDKNEQKNITMTSDEILNGLKEGKNLRVFEKEYVLSDKDIYMNINQSNVENPQDLFDELLKRLSKNKESREIIGGGFVAIELDRVLGKKLENQRKLVEFLSDQFNSEDENTRIFALRALTDDYFENSAVFSELSRSNIHYALKKYPELIDRFGTEIENAGRNLLMLVAKAGKTKETIQLLKEIRKKDPSKELLCTISLAKMGVVVEEEQNKLIEMFKSTNDVQEKYKLAYALSWLPGKKVQEALADALRTQGLLKPNPNRPPEMIRLHIAIALVRTIREGRDELPSRGAYGWREEDFIKIERWAVKHLGTKWNVPRPEYQPVKKVPF